MRKSAIFKKKTPFKILCGYRYFRGSVLTIKYTEVILVINTATKSIITNEAPENSEECNEMPIEEFMAVTPIKTNKEALVPISPPPTPANTLVIKEKFIICENQYIQYIKKMKK